MELYCIEGPDQTADKKIKLPNKIAFDSLHLFALEGSHLKPVKESKENVENAKHVNIKRIDHEFSLSEMILSVNLNMWCVKQKSLFFFGEGEQKVFVGSALQVIGRSTYSKITGNKSIYFNENPIDENGKLKHANDHQIAITPANEDQNNFVIVVAQNGCIIIAAGGFLVFDLPIVVVKSSGQYFTISSGPRNIMVLKKGVHVILLTKLETRVPIVLLRGSQGIREIKSESEILDKTAVQNSQKHLIEPEIGIEKIDMKDNQLVYVEYLPKTIFHWIHGKGYELKMGDRDSLLGIGPYSIVRRGKRISDSKRVAIKVIISDMDEITKRNGKPPQEILMAKKVNHQNIIKTFEICCVVAHTLKRRDTMFSFIIMELGTTDRLDKMIKREGKLTEDKAKHIFQQIVSAVSYLHTNYIAHCNIRLDNCVVFHNNVIKLCDFSQAENILQKVDDFNHSKLSSLKYMPPEVFESEKLDFLKIDIWMSACLLYSLLTANLSPFGQISASDQIAKSETFNSFIKRQNDGLPQDINISDKGKDLLVQMFKTKPNQRINAKQVLANDWFKQI